MRLAELQHISKESPATAFGDGFPGNRRRTHRRPENSEKDLSENMQEDEKKEQVTLVEKKEQVTLGEKKEELETLRDRPTEPRKKTTAAGEALPTKATSSSQKARGSGEASMDSVKDDGLNWT